MGFLWDFRCIGHCYFCSSCHSLLPKEQEEEMSCWGGAEGGCSSSQPHQLESELGLDFLCDNDKPNELPGPKFTSLRHLRQVNLGTIISLSSCFTVN